jgi:hypothetical protein
MTPWLTQVFPFSELQRIKQWHLEHALDHPVEYQLWDAVLTSWFMGWVGWLPTWVLDAWWACGLCILGMVTPQLYIAWRARAHTLNRLRCDWLQIPRR